MLKEKSQEGREEGEDEGERATERKQGEKRNNTPVRKGTEGEENESSADVCEKGRVGGWMDGYAGGGEREREGGRPL